MRKMIRPNNILHQRNQEINTATRKIGINLGNSIVLQNNIKIKQNNILVAIEPVRNEETEESQTVIVSDTQETDGDQQSDGEHANNFLFHGQGATRTNQTDNNLPPKS